MMLQPFERGVFVLPVSGRMLAQARTHPCVRLSCIVDTLTRASVLPGIDIIVEELTKIVVFPGHDDIGNMSRPKSLFIVSVVVWNSVSLPR